MPARTIAACLLITLACTQTTNADVIITFTEQPGSVEAEWNGTLNLAGLPLSSPLTSSVGGIRSGQGWFLGYSPTQSQIRLSTAPVMTPAMQAYGTNFTPTLATGFTGTAFGFDGGGRIGIESSYVSNSPLSGTLSFAGESYASLGLTPTTTPYEWTLTNGDKFFLSINSSAAVPEPSTFAVLAIAAFGVFGLRQRRKMQTHQSTDA